MPGKALTTDKRRSLLEELSQMPVDADTDDDVLRTFLPGPQYQRALDQRILIVRGERGAGKTALFQLLHSVERKKIRLSAIVPGAPDGRRIDGFAESGTAHPPVQVLEQFAASADVETLRAFWLGHLAGRLHAEGVGRHPLPKAFADAYRLAVTAPAHWTAAARRELPALYAWLDTVETEAKETCFVVYDHLDRVSLTNQGVRHGMSKALLGLWMSLSQRYARIRGKVLLREDLFQSTLSSFADATKLEARSVRIDWNAGRLFALLVRRMAAYDGLREWLEDVAHIEFEKVPYLGSVPPEDFDERVQQQFATALVGPYMGKGPTKGASHTWLINHLQDAHRRVTPRSLLQLVRGAASFALENGPQAVFRRLLTPPELRQSLEFVTSNRRVNELLEDYPVVGRLEGLRGAELFLSRREVVKALRSVELADGFDNNPEGAFEELLRIGVLSDRGSGRIDVPDVFRYEFEIKRKGGVRRVV
ncbi:hypothetical protein [Archangium sp.]|uniref:hypothetical protein n=1 Tax=Archangium sp. TaxID=1872627 RepID=UPI00286CC9F1|nr:hypothetical protein [Archangium sp.]